MIYDVSDRTMTHVSNLAYVNLESEVNKRIANASKVHSRGHLGAMKDEMGDWTIVKANDGGFFSAGFGGVAVKKGHDIVIGYRGTESTFEFIYDFLADVNLFISGTNVQSNKASKFAAELILEYEQANAYVTGHSLGGFLAQVVSYKMLEDELHNSFHPNSSNHTILREILLQGSHFKKGVTFNAAPFFYHTYGFFNGIIIRPEIPLKALTSNKYNEQVINYSIEGDFLQSGFVDTGSATKFGKIFPAYQMENTEKKPHALIQFYEHFPRYDN